MFAKIIEKARKAGFETGAKQIRTVGAAQVTLTYAVAPIGAVTDTTGKRWVDAAEDGLSLKAVIDLDHGKDEKDGKKDKKVTNTNEISVKGMTGELAKEAAAELNRVTVKGEPLKDADKGI